MIDNNSLIKSLLTTELIKRVRMVAEAKINEPGYPKEDNKLHVTRVYCEALLDSLIIENYEVVVIKDDIEVRLKK